MKINKNIFTMDSRLRDMQWYLRQGNLFRHTLNRFRWYWYPRFRYVARFPDHIDIEASSMCQLKCPMCFRHRLSISEGHMDFDLYKKIVDEASSYKIYSIKLSWRGEPLLNPRLPEMVAYAKDKGIREVAFLTNGERMTPELAQNLIDAGTDWITFSFDGLGSKYEEIRAPAKFDEAVERIRTMRQLRDKAKRSKPLIKVQTIWSAIQDNPGEYKNHWEPIVDKILFIPDKDFYSPVQHDPEYVCQYPWQRLTITWRGTVPLCIGDTNEKYLIGDATKQTLYSIWHSEAMQEVRRLHNAHKRLELKPCEECPEGRLETVTDKGVIPKDMGNLRDV